MINNTSLITLNEGRLFEVKCEYINISTACRSYTDTVYIQYYIHISLFRYSVYLMKTNLVFLYFFDN